MKTYLWLLILLSLSINTQAQHTLYGTITDSKTNEPIPGVDVYINDTSIGTTTDIEGKYTLKAIQKDSINVVFSFTGYQKKQVSVTFINDNTELSTALQESVFELDEVILSTPFNKLQSENVVRVEHKSLASMQKNGIQNIMDGIAQMSGVTQLSTGTGISKPVIRGLTGSRVLVYNQGVRLENFQFGEEHGIGIDESGINSVEIIKGPASLLYGSDAMGGVVYLEPEKYALPNESHFQFQNKLMSNTQGIYGNFGYKISSEKFQFIIRTAANYQADYKIPNGARVTNSRYNDKDIKFGIGYLGKKIKTDIRYNYNEAENGLPHGFEEQNTNYTITALHQALQNHYLSIKNNFTLANSHIKTNLGFTNHRRSVIDESELKIGMRLQTLNFNAKWYLPKWKTLESIIGVDGLLQNNNNFGIVYLLPDADIKSIGIFSTLNYTYKKISVQGGLRYDKKTIETYDIGSIVSPDFRPGFYKNLDNFTGALGFKITIKNNFRLRLNMASGFRAPNLSELGSKGLHDNRIEIGNPNLLNERNIQTDLSFEYEHPHIEFFTNTFYNRIHNYIYLAPNGNTQETYPVYQYLQNNAQLYGGEIGLHFHPHPLDWLHIESSFEHVIGLDNNSNYLPLIPVNKWKNQIKLLKNFKEKAQSNCYLNIGINYNFRANKISVFEEEQNAYTLFSIAIGGDFKIGKSEITTNFAIHNLFDKNYISHLSVLREDNIPNMGRNMMLTTSINL